MFLVLVFLAYFLGCRSPQPQFSNSIQSEKFNRNALLSTDFKSLDELKAVVQFEYIADKKSLIRLTHFGNGKKVTSILKTGISERDFSEAKEGDYWKKFKLGLKTPYAFLKKNDLMRVYFLSRRTDSFFGEGDIAFYDLAETMVYNISDEDFMFLSSVQLSEKGYLNTFNHVTAQTFMTAIFSEKLADFIADIHERKNMPELIVGNFSEEQLWDLQNGPIDNYVDMINNEWGQELGKVLQKKYKINRNTNWTPQLLANYLNDIQSYFGWVFQIGFKPIKPEDEFVKRFASKLNYIMKNGVNF